MDHTGNARGYNPFLEGYYTYPTWRNVLDARYGARNDGTGDQRAAIQFALNDNGRGGLRTGVGVTSQPAHVFVPGGIYILNGQVELRRGSILMGDPQNPPIFKAGPGFQGEAMFRGHDVGFGSRSCHSSSAVDARLTIIFPSPPNSVLHDFDPKYRHRHHSY